jgi:hypothetical protein
MGVKNVTQSRQVLQQAAKTDLPLLMQMILLLRLIVTFLGSKLKQIEIHDSSMRRGFTEVSCCMQNRFTNEAEEDAVA